MYNSAATSSCAVLDREMRYDWLHCSFCLHQILLPQSPMAQPQGTTGAAAPPPPVKAEPDPAPFPQFKTTAVKQESSHNTTNSQLTSQQSQELQSLPPVPHFVNSIRELRDLSDALSAFHRCYDDLQTHLDAIKSAIESKLAPQLPNVCFPASEENPTNDISTVVTQFQTGETPLEPSEEGKEVKEKSIKSDQSEVESLCVMMSSRGLRKYMVSNLGESNKLREEVPMALKLAPNPEKLVLECFGRFFLQGSKAYTRDSHMIPAREASVLMLECFLLMRGEDGAGTEIRIEKAVKEESEQAAVAWRKRLISEGGLAKASEIDARGLLLFLGCFGVPQVFRNENFRDLVRSGNVKEISGVLKRSRFLMAKIQDVIEGMVKNRKMAVDAVDLAYTFGLEDKFNTQTMLTSFLRDSKELWKKTKKTSQGSLVALNEANKKQLVALGSVVKCLECHNLDPTKILPGWQIGSQILRLEKDISDIENNIREKTAKKRKADDIESSKKSKTQELKLSCHTSDGFQLTASGVDSQRNLLKGIPNHTSSSLVSQTLLYGTGARLLPENISGLVTGIGGGALRAGVQSSMSTGAAGLLPTESYAGVHGGVLNAARQVIKYTSQPYGLHEDAALREQLGPHSYAGQASSLGLTSLYRSSLEGFTGLPSSSAVGVSSRSSASELYQFADTVDSESYYSRASKPVGAVPPTATLHHSSRLY